MVQPTILEKLEQLPESLQVEVLHYIEFLIDKQGKEHALASPKKKRQAGLLKGKIWMSDDFDAPLEDLKDYM
ncbi:type II toxin-antitoxin system VapB family antitoxin [Synechococcus elongatus]|uniref:type II toxin-antitoxin system VapB family antitoxin n=1 Tax=Synechococcus elongatus TaxID=32046 RepID=UPI0030CB1561